MISLFQENLHDFPQPWINSYISKHQSKLFILRKINTEIYLCHLLDGCILSAYSYLLVFSLHHFTCLTVFPQSFRALFRVTFSICL